MTAREGKRLSKGNETECQRPPLRTTAFEHVCYWDGSEGVVWESHEGLPCQASTDIKAFDRETNSTSDGYYKKRLLDRRDYLKGKPVKG